MRDRDRFARFAAPTAFLVAVMIAVLLVRSGLNRDESEATPLVTRTAQTTTARTTTAQTTTRAQTTTAREEEQFYTIESGDTLGEIAAEFDTTVDALLELNPGVDPAALTPGQRIRVK